MFKHFILKDDSLLKKSFSKLHSFRLYKRVLVYLCIYQVKS